MVVEHCSPAIIRLQEESIKVIEGGDWDDGDPPYLVLLHASLIVESQGRDNFVV